MKKSNGFYTFHLFALLSLLFSLSLPTPALASNPPVVSSIVRAGVNPTTGFILSFTVTFSVPVKGVDVTDFVVSSTGMSGGGVLSVIGVNSLYVVRAYSGTGSGTLRLDLIDNDSITDANNVPLGGAGAGNGNFSTGQIYNLTRANRTFASVTNGDYHSCALTLMGGAKCWGWNSKGELGNGSGLDINIPVNVSNLSTGVVQIAEGDAHTCVLTSAGAVKCFGWNGHGQLGNNSDVDSKVAVNVSGLSSGVTEIDLGGAHSCVVTSVGGIKCWGYDLNGQLGDGKNIDSSVPVDVTGLITGASFVVAGIAQSCGLTKAGAVKCWGSNSDGQLGNNSTDDSNVPVAVVGLSSNIVALAGGWFHTCALNNSGVVKCWGNNTNGQLGNGTNNASLVPVQVSNLSGVVAIAAGLSHTCALTSSGVVYCWGKNDRGQLGNSSGDSNVPVAVTALPGGITSIDAGYYHSCALTGEGNIKCWGGNDSGQLGDGTNNNSSIPVDLYIPAFVTSITRASANPTTASSVDFMVTFTKNVTGVDVNDFIATTSALTGAGVTNVSGANNIYTVTVKTGGGVGTLRLDLVDNNSILDETSRPLGGPSTGDGSFISGESYTVNRPLAGNFGKIGPINGGKGTTTATLSWGASSGASGYEFCYDSSGGSTCATPANWVPAGTSTHVSLSGLTPALTYSWQVRAINVNGAKYADGSSAAFWNFVVDNIPPMVSSIVLADTNPSTATTLHFTVKFSEEVTRVDVTDFATVNTLYLKNTSVIGVSGSGQSYIVTVNTGTGTGTLKLVLNDNDSIIDAAGNPLGGIGAGNGSYAKGPKYTLDRSNRFTSIGAQDGYIIETSEKSSVGGPINAVTKLVLGDDALNRQFRSILSFNTASLPDNAKIVSVILQIKKYSITGLDPFKTNGPLLADIHLNYFGLSSALESRDFQSTASMLNVGSFIPVAGTTGWYQVVMKALGIPYINKFGYTQFRLRFTLDDNNDHGADFVQFYSGEDLVGYRPVLIVQYTLP